VTSKQELEDELKKLEKTARKSDSEPAVSARNKEELEERFKWSDRMLEIRAELQRLRDINCRQPKLTYSQWEALRRLREDDWLPGYRAAQQGRTLQILLRMGLIQKRDRPSSCNTSDLRYGQEYRRLLELKGERHEF